MAACASRPTLIHVPVSHYSEKARWALDYKRIPHTRRWPPAGFHPLVTYIVTRGAHQTVPVLMIDGEGVGDSTEIIRRLEARKRETHRFETNREEQAEFDDFAGRRALARRLSTA